MFPPGSRVFNSRIAIELYCRAQDGVSLACTWIWTWGILPPARLPRTLPSLLQLLHQQLHRCVYKPLPPVCTRAAAALAGGPQKHRAGEAPGPDVEGARRGWEVSLRVRLEKGLFSRPTLTLTLTLTLAPTLTLNPTLTPTPTPTLTLTLTLYGHQVRQDGCAPGLP